MRERIRRFPKVVFVATILATGVSACSSPPTDGSTPLSKNAIFETVDLALDQKDCATAVAAIQPLYNSANTDNDVRLKMASAYGCDASIDFLPLVANIAAKGTVTLAGAGLWKMISEYFPSKTGGADYVVEGAELGLDAIQAVLNPGALVLPGNQVNPTSFNIGSVFTKDRTTDANLYLTFMAMAGVGGVGNRAGNPNLTTHVKTVDLPWKTAVSIPANSDGAAYASFVLNMIDGINATQNSISSLKSGYGAILTAFQDAMDVACDYGCKGGVAPAVVVVNGNPIPLNDLGKWQDTGCAMAAGCGNGKCPPLLRARSKAAGVATDPVSCAAAGVVNFINSSSLGWN